MSCDSAVKPQNWWEAEIEAGATFKAAFTYEDDDGPIDLTGATFVATLKRTLDTAVLLDMEDEGFITITSAAAGTFTLFIPGADTSALFGTYLHSIDIVLPGETVRVAQGIFSVRRASNS